MSDRVAIIGGSTVGWDHFPFAVAPYSDDVAIEGFVVELDTAMKWYWRVKKWHIAAYLEQEQVMGDNLVLDVEGDFDLSTALTLPDKSAPQRESDLVVPTYLYQFFSSGDNSMTVTLNYQINRFLPDGDFFYPIILHAFNVSTEQAIANTIRDLEEGGPLPDASIDEAVNCDDVTTLGYYYSPAGPVASAYITMTPTEFWPYATTAGLPVYDTTTGAQLRDPLS